MLKGHPKMALELLCSAHRHAVLSSRCPASKFPHFSSLGEEGDHVSSQCADKGTYTLVLVECMRRAKELEETTTSRQLVSRLTDHQLPAALQNLHDLFGNLVKLQRGMGGERGNANEVRSEMLHIFRVLMCGGGGLHAVLAGDVQDAELVNLAQCTAATASMHMMFKLGMCVDCGYFVRECFVKIEQYAPL